MHWLQFPGVLVVVYQESSQSEMQDTASPFPGLPGETTQEMYREGVNGDSFRLQQNTPRFCVAGWTFTE